MRYLSIEEVVELHRRVIRQSGGTLGVRDQGSLESSVLQPLQSFGDQDLYPTLSEKAAEIHVFVKGGHAFGLRRTESPITRWPQLVETWLGTIGVIPRAGTQSN